MEKRVVITGIGPVTSIGIGKEAFFEKLMRGDVPVRPIPDAFRERHEYRSRHYIPFPEFELEEYGIPGTWNLILQNEDRAAVLGAKLALEDAGIEFGDERAVVVVGVGTSCLQTAFTSYLAHLGMDHPHEMFQDVRFHRMVIPMTMANSPAAWISILCKLKGGCHMVNASCASGTIAIGEAYRKIADGRAAVVVTGGVESQSDKDGTVMRGFDVLGTLTTAEDGLPRPFCSDRSGFLFTEGGGTILVLEEMEAAVKRKAPIYAEIVDYVENSEAHNIVQQDKSGDQICEILRRLSEGRKIDYLNSHGTATLLNDQVEGQAIGRVFGEKEKQPMINSTKGILGHTIGASGAIEAAATALSISRSKIHGNPNGVPMEDVNLVRDATDAEIDQAISVSYGFGGHNAGLLLKRFVP